MGGALPLALGSAAIVVPLRGLLERPVHGGDAKQSIVQVLQTNLHQRWLKLGEEPVDLHADGFLDPTSPRRVARLVPKPRSLCCIDSLLRALVWRFPLHTGAQFPRNPCRGATAESTIVGAIDARALHGHASPPRGSVPGGAVSTLA